MNKKSFVKVAALALGVTTSMSASAVEVLFTHVLNTGHSYHADGDELAGYVNSLTGYNVTTRNLSDAVYTDYASFDQVWVYDLYTTSMGAQTNATQMANYTNIANWYNGLSVANQNLIADGRMISSAWNNESTWIQGYATELNDVGGGLVLGTDHNSFVSGINEINNLIGIDLFYGVLSTSNAVVDQASPLFNGGAGTYACGVGQQCVYDQSTPGYAPADIQPNGATLTPVAFHGTVSDAWTNAAISSTIGSETFGTCGGPNQPPCETCGLPGLPACEGSAPEPSILALLGLGLFGFGYQRHKQNKAV